MKYLFWASPFILVIAALASRRATSLIAGLIGMLTAGLVGTTAAPDALTGARIIEAAGRGLWLAWLVGVVILAGLFFRAAVSLATHPAGNSENFTRADLRRRRVFAACFLVGPFAEAATGFGVGQVTTVALLLTLRLAPLHVVILGLFSQILVPWGAMANGTMVGGAFSGLAPHDLGFHSALVSIPLVMAWLILFWRFCTRAGIEGETDQRAAELVWVAAMMGALVLANRWLGPEIAALTALGPLIVLRFWHDERPDRAAWLSLLPVGLPYATLIVLLALTRVVPVLNGALRAVEVRPFENLPAWFPLLHPGTWLVLVALLTILVLRQRTALPRLATAAWQQGWKAVATSGVFLVLAQIMAESGTAQSLAEGVAYALGAAALLATPVLAGAFGFVTGSGNATNALLMTSQVGLAAQYGLPLLWIAAIQNVAASALTMLSPVRVSMGCALAGDRRLEGQVYGGAWILGVVPVLFLILVCGGLLVQRHLSG